MCDRKSGILLHISSLPCEFGIGDLGDSAYRFVDFLYQTNQSYWQILPINPTDAIYEHSPYSSSSAFAGNVLFLSPTELVNDGMLLKDDIGPLPNFTSENVDFKSVQAFKKQLCDRAYKRYISDSSIGKSHQKGFADFVNANKFWLNDYALFVTIKNHFQNVIWTNWPKYLQERENRALQHISHDYGDEIKKVQFLQYIFFIQWDKLKTYCRSKGIRLIGDMPIYMNLDSADVWSHSHNYKLDSDNQPKVVAGVPPDYFSDDGQRWGCPVYDWNILQASQFSWWVERFRFNLQLFDVIRIDHFRGLVQCWEIPADEQTAVKGEWKNVPTDEFLKTLEQKFSKPLPIIAEDLGYITKDVRDVIRRFDLRGMKVLLFAFNNNIKEHPYLPHNYKERCVVYTGTHDNNTVLGWYKNDATQNELSNVCKYLNKEVLSDSVHWDMVSMAYRSDAQLAIIPMQDILGLGSNARMNKPATTNGNWRWRIFENSYSDELIDRLSKLTFDSKRD